jgi:hypothetical protein|uniref:Uncharacterized protein n=1 Tax=viral metagenome TaxID=1070528 RepID=A0A6C0BH39_9ZZZZ
MSAPLPQQGGMHQMIGRLHEYITTIDSPSKMLYGFLLVILIVYSTLIPSEYRSFADSMLGRVFGIAVVYGVVEGMGWIYGLLTALAFLLLINGAPAASEGFDGGGSVSEKKRIGNRWFVEQVLGECPLKIATDRVNTTAIQD